MTTASHRVTLVWGGRKPGRRVNLVQCDTRGEAVLAAVQWTVWSHSEGRPRKLPRYTAYIVEESRDGDWIVVDEGTLADATANYREENPTPAALSTVPSIPFHGGKAGQAPRAYPGKRRSGGTSRLATLVSRTLNDI